jgi:hypothetical protein
VKTLPRPNNKIQRAEINLSKRLMISVPLTGLIRAEWALARWGQVIPCNWSQVEMISWMDMFSPLGFLVADARNVAVHNFIQGNFEWLFFIDHDVILPPATFARWNDYMLKGDVPIFGGLYFTKSVPSEPLVYRGIGTSHYRDWHLGDKVWVDGMGLGCHMLHRSVLKSVYDASPEYQIGSAKARRVFETPSNQVYDAEHAAWITTGGTEDLTFYQRVKREGHLAKAGWPKYQKMDYPYLCDTSIFCRHINWDGVQYPSAGEEQAFVRHGK